MSMENVKKFNASNCDYATSVKNFQNWLMDKNGKMITDINYQRLTTKEPDDDMIEVAIAAITAVLPEDIETLKGDGCCPDLQ